MTFKRSAFVLLTLALASQAWASLESSSNLEDSQKVTSEAELARQAKVAKAYREGDTQTFLDEAMPEEIESAMSGQFADGYAERVDAGTESQYTQRFVVNLNNNRPGQRMYWFDHGVLRDSFKVSGAAAGMLTPRGTYEVHKAMVMAHSAKYDNSPMPCAFFFYKGGSYAIHGTEYVGRLGTPASHGCVRTDPAKFCPVWHDIVTRHEDHSIFVEVVDSVADVAGVDQIVAFNATHVETPTAQKAPAQTKTAPPTQASTVTKTAPVVQKTKLKKAAPAPIDYSKANGLF